MNHNLFKKKYLISLFKKLILIFGFTFLLLEVVLAIYTKNSNLNIEIPTYSLENTQSFWYDINKNFGTSHLPNNNYRQKKTCFDVTYQSNSKGFRDQERAIRSSNKRVLVLGDSFIEGVGVSREFRLSNLLEKEKNIPHLNFGMAGNFGSTQYYMLYKTLASSYTHDAILIGVLPANDFIDDDYEINLKINSDRYRPYLVGDYPHYSLTYHLDSIQKSRVHSKKLKPIKKIFKNFTYSYNVLLYAKSVLKQSIKKDNKIVSEDEIPGYFNYSEKQLNRLKYSLEQIKSIAGEREVMVFTIPVLRDIQNYKKHKNNPLGKEMSAFCKSIGIKYLDLLLETDKISIKDSEEQFLTCDGHWSKKGNVFAKKHIQSFFDYYN
ncbi:SGNH/GDSL hydrolase family protein [Aquimarina latercula]|uniref:SGNH/GDSL hydrolase family protein n=1 Tax=Aquimarina latercula TaxID=987 RepID=UPI000408F92F|nr:SGNH/GDSL hydrolase family protein [Aquimarina latercula]